jgi:hypothetical protein
MEPLISIRILDQQHPYQPGDLLQCEYQVDAVEARDVQSLEASVLWHTEGKGDEDMAVHYFERRLPNDAEDRDLRSLRTFTTILPNSPLTYAGIIVKVRWCVRVRVFLRRGKAAFLEHPFELGSVPQATAMKQESDETTDDEAAEPANGETA